MLYSISYDYSIKKTHDEKFIKEIIPFNGIITSNEKGMYKVKLFHDNNINFLEYTCGNLLQFDKKKILKNFLLDIRRKKIERTKNVVSCSF